MFQTSLCFWLFVLYERVQILKLIWKCVFWGFKKLCWFLNCYLLLKNCNWYFSSYRQALEVGGGDNTSRSGKNTYISSISDSVNLSYTSAVLRCWLYQHRNCQYHQKLHARRRYCRAKHWYCRPEHQYLCRVPMLPHWAPISLHWTASVREFRDISQCFTSVLCCFASCSWCFMCVSQCFTSVLWCLTMFYDV